MTAIEEPAGCGVSATGLEASVERARRIAETVLAPDARRNDEAGRFSGEAVAALGEAGLLGLMLPEGVGGLGAGPGPFAEVVAALAEADASVAMVYLMHSLAAAVVASAPPNERLTAVLREMAAGRHLSTLAFSEAGSRSHFWAPVSRARRSDPGVLLSARKSWVTSAGRAQSYVVSALSPDGEGATDSVLYLVPGDLPGLAVAGPWNGLGLRANASAPMTLDACSIAPELALTAEGGGFGAMMGVVLPLFNLGSACVALGLCRAAVRDTTAHLKAARFEHLGQSLGEALPTLRALLATMVIDTEGLAARVDGLVDHLVRPRDATMVTVLATKAAAGETAIAVTSAAMRAAGGAAFSRHLGIERLFRDAQAGAVMAPTADALREFIGRATLGMELF